METITSRENAKIKYACAVRDSEKQRAAEEAILNDSWVQELMRTHQARMLPAAPR